MTATGALRSGAGLVELFVRLVRDADLTQGASTRRLAASSIWRLNSTVMALSPLGKRRGGESVAAMASQFFVRTSSSVFCAGVEFAIWQMRLQDQ